MHDILIRGGTVIDGSGAPGFAADVAVDGDRIAAVAPGLGGAAKRVIDARGHVVAPGLVDIHTHSDYTLPINPRAESKIRQGITTEVVGNCGFSIAPALPGKVGALEDYLRASAFWLPFKETTFAEYLDSYPATSVNMVPQVGHNTLRLMTVGMERRKATEAEIAEMGRLVEEAMAAGALGLSSGLFTAPGANAGPEEILALARIVARHGGRYSTHLRDEGNGVFDAVREAIDVARQTGVHVQIAHLKLSGIENWGKSKKLLGEIDAARKAGIPVDCDQYPYDTGSNPLRNLLPAWVQEGGVPKMVERLRDPAVRARLRAEIERDGLNNFGKIPSWDAVTIALSKNNPQHAGRRMAALAKELGREPFDQVCETLIADEGHTRILVTSMSEEDVRAITGTPWVLVGSDGTCLAAEGVTSAGLPHPRFYGSHARTLGCCVRDLKLLTLEQAVHKMTGGSAAALGWSDRGWVKPGMAADLVVFDPATIADTATYQKPHQYAKGVSTVIVNGAVVIDGGEHNGALPGRVLRRAPARPH